MIILIWKECNNFGGKYINEFFIEFISIKKMGVCGIRLRYICHVLEVNRCAGM